MERCHFFFIPMPIPTKILNFDVNFDFSSSHLKFPHLACNNKLTNCFFFFKATCLMSEMFN